MLIITELEKLLVERWIVGEDTYGVVVNLEAVTNGLDNDAGSGGIAEDPVEFGYW